ncbi:MAG: hypothetical protein H6Q72_914 [Firmicutes bacterium]|nr:hypothetical protein [Bacillota bacterium]
MKCLICGREPTTYDWLIIDGKVKGPVCHGGYDCYRPGKAKPVSPKMRKVRELAERFAS